MEFEAFRGSPITAETDTVQHFNLHCEQPHLEMQRSFPDKHKSLLEDARDAIFKLSCFIKKETKNGTSTSSSFWVKSYILF